MSLEEEVELIEEDANHIDFNQFWVLVAKAIVAQVNQPKKENDDDQLG